MFENSPPAEESAAFDQAALRIIERRRLRIRFFDSQFFGEHGWDLLLLLFAQHPQPTTIVEAGRLLELSPSTVMVMARLLSSHGLVTHGDSDGAWEDIPLRLAEAGEAQVRGYFEQIRLGRLAA